MGVYVYLLDQHRCLVSERALLLHQRMERLRGQTSSELRPEYYSGTSMPCDPQQMPEVSLHW